MNRHEILLSMFDSKGKGLEIGPSFNPLLPKAQGYDVEILDHLDAAALREKYKDAAVNLDAIEEVDYVSDGSSIAALIGKPSHFDHCVALHVLEHTVDLLGFLLDCQSLLKPTGKLVLAVPDKRFSFDVLRPLTSTGDVLEAHINPASRHAPGKLFDEFAYNALRDGKLAWPRGQKGPVAFFNTLEQAKNLYEHFLATKAFADIHAWQFTPSSLRLILSDLAEIGFIRLKESSFVDNGTGEFYITLSEAGAGCAVSRIDLAWNALVEQAEIIYPASQ